MTRPFSFPARCQCAAGQGKPKDETQQRGINWRKDKFGGSLSSGGRQRTSAGVRIPFAEAATIPPAYQNIPPNHLSVPPGHLAFPIGLLTLPPGVLSVSPETLAVRIKPLSAPPEHLVVRIEDRAVWINHLPVPPEALAVHLKPFPSDNRWLRR